MQNNNVIISICVLSFNSEKTILDTLESIYNQTHNDFELIISDDGSSDNTIKIAKEWIIKRKERFIKSSVLTIEHNTGTPSNCNRAFRASSGNWIKFIAADDCLLPNYIEDNVNFIKEHPDAQIIYSNYYGFITNKNGKKEIIEKRYNDEINQKFDTIANKQLYYYLRKGINISPTALIKKNLIEQVDGFIEKYKVFEDTPFFTKVLLSNTRIFLLPKYTVLYRKDTNSVTRDIKRKHFYKKTFIDTMLQFKKEMVYPLFKWYQFDYWIEEYSFRLLYNFTITVLRNKRTKLNNIIYLLFKSVNPYYLIKRAFR